MPPIKSPKSPNPVDVHVGSRVKSLRMQMKMSQTDLGDRLGITFQQIQKYEKGYNRISSSRLHQIGEIFGVSPPHFFEGPISGAIHRGQVDESAFDEFCASRDGVALMRAFMRISDKAIRHAIAKMVEELE